MEIIEIGEYKKLGYRKLICPSGLEVTVKEISNFTVLKCSQLQDLALMIEELFKSYLVSPQIPEEITMEDFLWEDFAFLQSTLLEEIEKRNKEIKKEMKDPTNAYII